MAELAKDIQTEEEKKQKEEEDEKNRVKREDEMKLLVSKLEGLNGPPLEVPEYKDAYKVYNFLIKQKPKFSHFSL